MRRRKVSVAVGAAVLAVAAGIGPASAQDADQDRRLTVMTRPHPELEPLGARLGSFVLYPNIGVGETYTDNAFKTQGNRRDDFVLHVTPAARLESDWNNNELELGVEADVATYADNGSEDYEDVSGWANGRFDVARSTNVFAGVRMDSLHEDRGSPDDVAGVEPTTFDRLTANIGASQRLNRVTLEGEARFVDLDFDDVGAAGGGVINNDDRDRNVYLGAVKLGYEVAPEYSAFLRGTVNRRAYRAQTDDLGFNRDSYGYNVVVGTEFDLTGVTFGEVHAGYREQIYEDRRFDALDGVSFGARLTSNVTPLTTLQLFVDREIEESSVTTGEGYWSTSVRFTADHELLRNLIISANLSYGLAEYEGVDRDDDVYGAGLAALYQFNRHLGLKAGYEYEARDSGGTVAGMDYSENMFLVRLAGRY